MVLVEAHAGGKVGLGYTYTDLSAGRLIAGQLTDAVARMDAMAVQAKHLVEEVS